MPAYPPPLSVTPEERAEARRKRAEKREERKYLADSMVLSLADIEYVLVKFKGSIAKAAQHIGTKRDVLARKIQGTPHLVAVMNRIKEEKIDLAEYKLAEQVENGYFPAIALTLKTLGQHRGYTERATLEHEMSDKGIRDAATLIEAMKRSLTGEEMKMIEEKEYEWDLEAEAHLLPPS